MLCLFNRYKYATTCDFRIFERGYLPGMQICSDCFISVHGLMIDADDFCCQIWLRIGLGLCELSNQVPDSKRIFIQGINQFYSLCFNSKSWAWTCTQFSAQFIVRQWGEEICQEDILTMPLLSTIYSCVELWQTSTYHGQLTTYSSNQFYYNDWLTSWTRVIAILTAVQLLKKFPAFNQKVHYLTQNNQLLNRPQPAIYSTYPQNLPVFLSTYATNILFIPQYKFNVRATCVYPVRWLSGTYTNIHNAIYRFTILTRYPFSIIINMSILKQSLHEVKNECFFLCFLSLILLIINVH